MAALSLSGCSGQDAGSGGLPPTKYVAVLETIDESFTVIEGNTSRIPPMTNPPYPFDVDGSLGLLPEDVVFNRSLKFLYATAHFTYHTLNRQASGFEVTGIYRLPHDVDANLTVLDVDRNGTVHFRFGNESVYLKVGEQWVSPALSSRTEITDFDMNVTDYTRGTTPVTSQVHIYFKTRYDATVMLENRGVFDKSDVKNK